MKKMAKAGGNKLPKLVGPPKTPFVRGSDRRKSQEAVMKKMMK